MKIFQVKKFFGRINLIFLEIPNVFEGFKVNLLDKRFAKKNTFISLGTNCYFRMILSKYGLKARRKDGELSYPFDLVKTQIDSILNFLKTDFEDFFENIEYSEADKIFIDRKYHSLFSHDKFKSSEKGLFINRYIKRINNFKNLFKQNNRLLFCSVIFDDFIDADVINQIYDNLKRMEKQSTFDYCVMHLVKNDNSYSVKGGAKINENIHYIKMNVPIDNYSDVWHLGTYRKLPQVMEFEANFVNEIYNFYNS